MITRDELISALRGYRSMIVEADEWRPLVDHILELARQGYFNPECSDPVCGLPSELDEYHFACKGCAPAQKHSTG